MIRKFLEENSDLAIVITRDDDSPIFDPSFCIDIRKVKSGEKIFTHVVPDYVLNSLYYDIDLETALMTPVIKAWESKKAREEKGEKND